MEVKVEVKLDFINKKGESKHVKFYIDRKTYEILQDESVSEEMRHAYLVDEYHEYEKERYHNRKFVSFDSEMAEAMDLIKDDLIISKTEYELDFKNNKLKDAIKKLTSRQQEMIKLVYFEGKSQKELSEIYGVSKQAINNALDRIYKTLKKFFEKN